MRSHPDIHIRYAGSREDARAALGAAEAFLYDHSDRPANKPVVYAMDNGVRVAVRWTPAGHIVAQLTRYVTGRR